MSLQAKILSLISGIDDPEIRMEIARTIYFLFDVFRSGNVKEDEIYQALFDVALTVVNYKEPFLPDDEKRKKAGQIADELYSMFKMQSLFYKTFKRTSLPRF